MGDVLVIVCFVVTWIVIADTRRGITRTEKEMDKIRKLVRWIQS